MKVQKGKKRLQFDKSENEKSQRFINHKSNKYISFYPPLSQKKSNRPLNLDKEIKSLTYLINI